MPLLLAVTLAAAIQPTCSWDSPGRNPYTGSTAAAIDRYTDIPAAVRSTLKRRMEEHQPDDNVSITRDSIGGKSQYNPAIHDMHFGAASVCASVSRNKWAETRAEPAAVYCVGEHCILVPKICGNVSRISRLAPAVAQAPAAAAQASDHPKQPEFADISLSDPELRDKELVDMPLDEMEDGKRPPRLLASTTGNGVDEFVLADDLNLDDLASQIARHGGFGIGIDGDNAIHTAVPEADTWAMLLGGLGLMGWIGRRRARKSAQ
jgi:hypothetical protein